MPVPFSETPASAGLAERADLSRPGLTQQPTSAQSRQPIAAAIAATPRTAEIGGPPGPEPTRFGDWELRGRCIDF